MSSHSWFSRALLPWYREHGRDLPWRRSSDPYLVWLSEVILQQTRVDQGLPYYERFARRYPTLKELARARETDVLKLWQGLGYYSRGRNLLKAARQVVERHGGRFPRTHTSLIELAGVGDYTAAAIASISFNEAVPVVDGNVYRVLSRVFGMDTPIDSNAGRKIFREKAASLLDPARPGDYNQAVMELGATVCTPRKPVCEECPLRSRCIARKEDRIERLPMKGRSNAVRERHFNYLHIEHNGTLFMRRRNGRDIWRGLFELPLIESSKALTRHALERELGTFGNGWRVISRSPAVKHALSHQVIHAVFWRVRTSNGLPMDIGWKAVPLARLERQPVPRLIERWLFPERG